MRSMHWVHQRVCPLFVMVMLLVLGGCAAQFPKAEVEPGRAEPPPVLKPTEVVPPVTAPVVEDIEPEATFQVAATPQSPPTTVGTQGKEDAAFLENRITDLEARALQWRKLTLGSDEETTDLSLSLALADCLGRAEELIRDYGKLRDAVAEPTGLTSAGELPDRAGIYRRDLELMTSDCPETEQAPASFLDRASEAAGLTAANMETLVANQVAEGKDHEAIATFQRLKNFFPNHQTTPVTLELYGRALLRTGHLSEAVEVLQSLLPDPSAMTKNPWERQRLVADLLLIEGDRAEARALYEKVVAAGDAIRESSAWAHNQLTLLESHDARSGPMLAYIELMRGFFTSQEGDDDSRVIVQAEQLMQTYPGTEMAYNAESLQAAAEARLTRWLGDRLSRADEQVAEKRFREAVTLLESLVTVSLPPDLHDMVRNTLDQVTIQESEEMETQRQERQQALAARWEEAVGMLDAMQYDEAIAGFKMLLATDYDTMAREKIKQATGQAVAEKRRDAANLFVKAGHTEDRQQKGQLLLASRKLLKEIVEKYPEADLIDKVQDNLKILDDQIRRFDPDLLSQVDETAPESPSTRDVDNATLPEAAPVQQPRSENRR